MALGRMNAGAISEAQQWLARSARFDPHDGKTELMKAACFRRLYRRDGWSKALESAERKGASRAEIRHEMKLGLIESGELGKEANELGALIEGGGSAGQIRALTRRRNGICWLLTVAIWLKLPFHLYLSMKS